MGQVRVDRLQGATFVELFFDLVFVYAVTQLTSFVLHDLTWSGVGHAVVLFWLVWWSWTQFTWTLNEADTEHAGVRVLTLVATAVAFFLAQAVPDAFGDAGLWFAAAYVVGRLIGLIMQWRVVGQGDAEELSAMTRWLASSSVGLVLVLAGGFVDGDVRLWLWVGAIVADLGATVIAGSGNWALEPGHFAERHGLIVIIALGESLIAAGIASSEVTRDATFAAAASGAVVAACGLWWTYFGSMHSRLEEAMHATAQNVRGLFARDVFSLAHALIVAGVIGVAVGFEEAIAHPSERLHDEAALAFVVGAMLFVGGLAIAAARAGIRDILMTRVSFLGLMVVGHPIIVRVDAAIAVWVLAVLSCGLAVAEHYRQRHEPT